jgi:hypothetical protein
MKTLEQCLRETMQQKWPGIPETVANRLIDQIRIEAPSIKLSRQIDNPERIIAILMNYINTISPAEAEQWLRQFNSKN